MTSDSGPEREFWQIALADLERQLGAGRNGLTSAEAGARRLRYGPNTLEERRRLSLPPKFLSRFRNPLVIILLAAAVISALTGDLTSFIIISTIVLMSAALDTVQEFRAEQAAESLKVSEARRWPSRTREMPPDYTPVLSLPSLSGASRSSGLVTVRIVVLATRV